MDPCAKPGIEVLVGRARWWLTMSRRSVRRRMRMACRRVLAGRARWWMTMSRRRVRRRMRMARRRVLAGRARGWMMISRRRVGRWPFKIDGHMVFNPNFGNIGELKVRGYPVTVGWNSMPGYTMTMQPSSGLLTRCSLGRCMEKSDK